MFRLLAACVIVFQTVCAKECLVIGIAGGTGSGKTTLAKKIQEAFPGQSVLISQDSYYKDLTHLPLKEREKTNFDHPDSIDFDLLAQHISILKSGGKIEKPIYSFHHHTRESYTEAVAAHKIIIVEGILLFAMPELSDLCDLRLFVDTDDDVRLMRRIHRDIHERSRSLESVFTQYLTTVKPMHDAFVQPSKKKADLIVPHGGENPKALDVIITKLKQQITFSSALER